VSRTDRFAILTPSLAFVIALSSSSVCANPPVSNEKITTVKTTSAKTTSAKTTTVTGAKTTQSMLVASLTGEPTRAVSPTAKSSLTKSSGKPGVAIIPIPATVRTTAARVPGFNTPGNVADWRVAAVEITAAGRGRINYEAGVMKAIGLGAMAPPTLKKSRSQDILDAREAALADGLRVLNIAASQVRVTADTRVANYILKSDEIRVRVEGVVNNAEVIEEKMLPSSGVYRVIVMARLTGPNSLLEAVSPSTPEKGDASEIARLAADTAPVVEKTAPAKPKGFAPGDPAPGGAEYTGLIIDCRGLDMSSCMSPKIYDEDGDEVYGTMKVEPEYVIETGIASFPRSMQEARRSSRVGDRPLVIRAIRVADQNRYYAVIPRSLADRARAANQTSRYFERTAVCLVLDPIR